MSSLAMTPFLKKLFIKHYLRYTKNLEGIQSLVFMLRDAVTISWTRCLCSFSSCVINVVSLKGGIWGHQQAG